MRAGDTSIPPAVAAALLPLVTQLEQLDAEIKQSDAAITRLAKTDPVANTLMSIPGIGPVSALELVVSVGDPSSFSEPRQFAAFLGQWINPHSKAEDITAPDTVAKTKSTLDREAPSRHHSTLLRLVVEQSDMTPMEIQSRLAARQKRTQTIA